MDLAPGATADGGARGMKAAAALVLVLAQVITWSGARADIESGVAALGRGEYDRALDEFKPAAENGDRIAQSYLGYTYQLMEQYEQAYAWYYTSAECGSVDARIERATLETKMTRARVAKATKVGTDYARRYCKH